MQRAVSILGRSLRLRCPRCGQGAFLEHGFSTRWDCKVCRLRFEREEGYWTGAIYVNLVATQFLIVGGLFVMMFGTDLGPWTQISILAVVGLVFPIGFYPFSKSIWLGMDYYVNGAAWGASPAEKEPPPLDSPS